MIYLDTSVIVKLYVREDHSIDVSNWVKSHNESIPLTAFHDLEFTHAVHLKQFRKELTAENAHAIISRYHLHERIGVYYRPPMDWPTALTHAVELSRAHTCVMGTRSLDILHVASALTFKSHSFVTSDQRQAELASRAGLHTISIGS